MCDSLDADRLREVGASLHTQLRELRLNFYMCRKIDMPGLSELVKRLPANLEELTLVLSFCPKIDDECLRTVGRGLPTTLKALRMSFNGCRKLGSAGVAFLADNLPSSLHTLELNLATCKNIHSIGFGCLIERIPASIQTLSLDFQHSLDAQSARYILKKIREGAWKNLQAISFKPKVDTIVQVNEQLQQRSRARHRWKKAYKEVTRNLHAERDLEIVDLVEAEKMRAEIAENLQQSDLDTLEAMLDPPRVIKEIGRAVILLLQPHSKMKTSWWRFRRFISQVGSLDRFRDFQVRDITEDVLQRVDDLMQLPTGQSKTLQETNRAAWKLASWVLNCIRIRRIALGRMPQSRSPTRLPRHNND